MRLNGFFFAKETKRFDLIRKNNFVENNKINSHLRKLPNDYQENYVCYSSTFPRAQENGGGLLN